MTAATDPAVLHERGDVEASSADAAVRVIAGIGVLRRDLPAPLQAVADQLVAHLEEVEPRRRADALRLFEQAVAGYRRMYGAEMAELASRATIAEELTDVAVIAAWRRQ